jgi:NADP-dependent 3-hydroxy acid dehydrogenase YdfG
MPLTELTGRVVAITGASSGIGEATALAAARAGAAVALAARRTDRIEALAERIIADGGRALAVATDVSDEDQARTFVHRAHTELGGLDALVNNAGVMLLGPIMGADTSEWRRMVDANVFGVLWCTHAALPLMAEQGSGHIVNVSSTAGRFASARAGVYNLTKWGVNGFSEALRQEAIDAGIRVTILEPGLVHTELQSHNSEQAQEMLAQRFEGVEGLRAEDMADAILFALRQPEHVAINEMLVRPARQRT